MKKVLLLMALSAAALKINAQIPVLWEKSLGGLSREEGWSMAKTSDGGYILAGQGASADGDMTGFHGGLSDAWIVKLDANGNIQWQKAFGGTNDDYAYSVIQTMDGGYAFAGYTSSNDGDASGNHGNDDFWVVKLDNSGNIEWQKTLGSTGWQWGYAIVQTTNGEYVIAGRTSGAEDGDVSGTHGALDDIWVVRLSATGALLWQKCYGGSGYELGYSLANTLDGGFIVAGSTAFSNDGDVSGSHSGYDIWVIKADASGTLNWQLALGGTNDERAYSVIQSIDSGYVIAGYTKSTDGDVSSNQGYNDFWIVKLNNSGTLQWQKTFGGSATDVAWSIAKTNDGGYVAAGYSASNDGDISQNKGQSDYWITKLGSNGNLEWEQSLGGEGYDWAYSIIQNNDSSYVINGGSDSKTGDVSGNHGGFDYWVVKLKLCWSNSTYSQNLTICDGQSVTVGNNTYTISGTYTDTLTAFNGCDSIVTTNLSVLSNSSFSQSPAICSGQSVTVGSKTYITAGTYMDTLTAVNGCDSIVTTVLTAFSNTPTVTTAQSVGGSDYDYGGKISMDANGNMYLTGSFNSSSITFGSFPLNNKGNFLVKYDSKGNVAWAKDKTGGSVRADKNNNVYAVGNFTGSSIAFDTFTLTNNNPGTADIYIVKYNTDGNVIWAKKAGGDEREYSSNIMVDDNDNLYIIGSFSGASATFDSINLTNSNPGFEEIYVVKYDADGNVLWAKSAGGADKDYGRSISTDGGGNVYLTGYFVSSSVTFESVTLLNNGFINMYLAKYDATGNLLWAKNAGGSGYRYGNDVITDADGNVYVTGTFENPSVTFGLVTLTNNGGEDLYLVKYDSAGNVLWAKSSGGNLDDYGYGLCNDINGNVYLTGAFNSSSVVFDDDTLFKGGFNSDLYFVKYNAAGNVLWAKSASGNDLDYANNIATDMNGNVYVTGSFYSSSLTFDSITLTNVGSADIFLLKIEGAFLVTPAIAAGGPVTFCQGDSVILNASTGGNLFYQWKKDGADITGANAAGYTANQPGNYNLIVTTAEGCPATSAIITVTVNANPDAAITAGGDTTFCQGGSIVLTSDTAKIYTWSTGDTTQTIIAKNSGNYSLTITDANGCKATDVISITVLSNSIFYQNPVICDGQSVMVGSNIYTASGTYIDTLAAANGCDSIVTTGLIVNPLPTVSAGNDTTIKLGGMANLNASGGDTCSWSPITNVANPNNCNTTASPKQTTTYSVTVTDTNGCTNTASITVTVDSSTGIHSINNSQFAITVSPNPFSISATIIIHSVILSSPTTGKNLSLTLYDVLGRQVQQLNDLIRNNSITRNGLKDGIYFYKISNEKKGIIGSGKLIIQ